MTCRFARFDSGIPDPWAGMCLSGTPRVPGCVASDDHPSNQHRHVSTVSPPGGSCPCSWNRTEHYKGNISLASREVRRYVRRFDAFKQIEQRRNLRPLRVP